MPPTDTRYVHEVGAMLQRVAKPAYRRARRMWRAAPYRLAQAGQRIDDAAIALTFDDGPGLYTSEVLDVLAEHQVVATFFLVGRNAEAAPSLVARMLEEGHGIASHSLTHPDPHGLSARKLFIEYRDGRRAVEQVAQRDVPLFRPPKGYLQPAGALAARAAHTGTWLWSRGGNDWSPENSAEEILELMTPVQHGDVVLLHDAPRDRRPQTVTALKEYLSIAHEGGASFVRLEDAHVSAAGHGQPRIPYRPRAED